MQYISTGKRLAALVVVGIAIGINVSALAATIRVPQDQPTITAGVAVANNGDTVYVSAGTYYEFNIQITNSITVSSINGPTNTIIDNQHLGKGMIVKPPASGNVAIVGFTIQNGQCPESDGGGGVDVVSGQCQISRCIIQGVSGPGDYSYMPINNNNNGATIFVDTCIVRNNFAANGAGISGSNVRNCWIYNNTGGNNCAAMWGCNATNCTVYGNGGGATGNSWTVGGGNGGNYDNCIFWDNLPSYNNQEIYQPSGVSYCIVEGGYSGTGNQNTDPLFVNPAAGNFNLQSGSPAIGAGDPAVLKPDGSRSDVGASGDINSGFPISFSPSFLTNGLVAYYPFNGNANDESGSGNNGTVYEATLTADRFGNPNAAYYFNGTNSYIDVPQNAVLNSLTTNVTLSAWIWQAGAIPDGYMIVSKSETRWGNGWTFDTCDCSASDGHRIRLQTGGNNSSCNVPGGTVYSLKQWHHVVATVSGTNGSVYLDGILDGSGSVGNIPVNTLDVFIGYPHVTEGADADAWFNGIIDDVRIYNRALSSNEVAELYAYESAVPGTTAPPSITNQPASVTNNLGDNVALSVGATGVGPMDFQWYFSGTNLDNRSNSTLNISGMSQPYFGNYFVIVTNASGSVTSSIATIYEPATIVSQPANLVVPLQAPATFSVAAVGFPAPNYQWSLNGTNLTGANSNSLTISSVKMNNTGNYQVLVSNSISSTNSAIATLDLSPSITSPFIGATPIWGRNTTLSVGAVGNGTLTYQWYVNGQPISGAVYPQLDFTSIQLTNSGFYSVVISSPYGSITNTAYQVAVQPSVVTLGFYPGLTINGAAGNSYLIQRSANLSNTNNWQTLSSLTMYQPIELWIDTSVDATSPFNNGYFYQLIPQ